MFTVHYDRAIEFVAEKAPTIPTHLPKGTANNFFTWAEEMAEILSFIYSYDHQTVLEGLVEAIKELQNEDDEETLED